MRSTGKLGLVTLVMGAIAWSTWANGSVPSDAGGRDAATARTAAVRAPSSTTTSGAPGLPPRRGGSETETAAKGTGEKGPAGVAPSTTSPARSEISPTSGSPETAAPAARSGFFAGFWPESGEAEAAEMQRAFDDGHQPWRGDPEALARLFAEHIAGWTIEVTGSEFSGSAADGWGAVVKFRVFIGEEELRPITNHTLRLVGLRGAEHPVWFVSGLASDHIEVDSPSDGATVPSPVGVAGRASAYEGNVHVEVRDDSGQRLHSGSLQAEGVDMAPFHGSLELAPTTTRGGILMLSGDAGTGPVPDMTIVRIRFR